MTGEKGYKMADVLSKLGASNPCSTKVNPIVGNYSAPRELYKHIWTEYDLNQYCNYLIWGGLPEGLTSWNLNRMLYFRGSLAGFKLGGDIYILPYVITGGINCYGLPNAIQPITFNGGNLGKGEKIDPFGKELKLPMGRGGVGVEAPGAVILYDSVPWAATMASPSRYTHNQVIINEIAETLARININMVVANKKFFFVVRDESQAQVVRFELNQAFSSDSPFTVITNPMEIQNIQDTKDDYTAELFGIVKNWDSIRCFISGIQSRYFGADKKERLITDEMEGQEEQTDLVGNLRFRNAKQWADDMNRYFGSNITVSINEVIEGGQEARNDSDEYEEEGEENGEYNPD